MVVGELDTGKSCVEGGECVIRACVRAYICRYGEMGGRWVVVRVR